MSFLINPYAFGAGVLTAITQVLSATSTGETITVPSGVIAGDLLVLMDSAISASLPDTVIPSGFTQISNQTALTGNDLRVIISYKLAVGTEASTNLTGMDGALDQDKVLLVFRGNIPATLLTLADVGEESTSGNPVAQTVTAATGVAPLVVFGCYNSNDPVTTRTMSPAKDGELNSGTGAYIAWKIYNTSPADVSVDMNDEGDRNILQSFYMQMA